MVGDDLRVVAANRQVCPTISEITFGSLYNLCQRAGVVWPASMTIESVTMRSRFGQRTVGSFAPVMPDYRS